MSHWEKKYQYRLLQGKHFAFVEAKGETAERRARSAGALFHALRSGLRGASAGRRPLLKKKVSRTTSRCNIRFINKDPIKRTGPAYFWSTDSDPPHYITVTPAAFTCQQCDKWHLKPIYSAPVYSLWQEWGVGVVHLHSSSSLESVFSPGWCGSTYSVLACEPKGHWFDSQSGHMSGLWTRSPVGGAQEATIYWCFSPPPKKVNK